MNKVESELLKSMITNRCTFWDIMSCSLLEANRPFRGTCGLHIQDRKVRQARNLYKKGSNLSQITFRGNVSLPGRRFTFNGLHDVISQKREIFMNSVVIRERHYFSPRKLELNSNTVWDILAVLPFVTLSSP
jgi:hypothetical protein